MGSETSFMVMNHKPTCEAFFLSEDLPLVEAQTLITLLALKPSLLHEVVLILTLILVIGGQSIRFPRGGRGWPTQRSRFRDVH